MYKTFGEMVRKRRLDMGMALRTFCQLNGYDPSNHSKIERSVNVPPTKVSSLFRLGEALEISGDKEWKIFFMLAAIDAGRIPKHIMDDRELLGRLPMIFCSLDGKRPTKEFIEKVVDMVKLRSQITPQDIHETLYEPDLDCF